MTPALLPGIRPSVAVVAAAERVLASGLLPVAGRRVAARTFTCSLTRAARSQSWARRITGTSPAHDTRFGSSNRTDVSLALCNNHISQMPFGPGV
ncbi:MAG: hypothetical protein ACRDRH_00090 [Pseudonocardia sp.]